MIRSRNWCLSSKWGMTDRVRVSDGKSWSKDKFMLKALKPEISLMQECVKTVVSEVIVTGLDCALAQSLLGGREQASLFWDWRKWCWSHGDARCQMPEKGRTAQMPRKVCVGCSVYPSALTQAKISCEFKVHFLLRLCLQVALFGNNRPIFLSTLTLFKWNCKEACFWSGRKVSSCRVEEIRRSYWDKLCLSNTFSIIQICRPKISAYPRWQLVIRGWAVLSLGWKGRGGKIWCEVEHSLLLCLSWMLDVLDVLSKRQAKNLLSAESEKLGNSHTTVCH